MTRDDLYPSRHGARPEILDRRDPVTYDGVPGPIDDDTLACYAERGFLHLPALFDAGEVAAFQAELDRLAEDPEIAASHRAVAEPDADHVLRSIFEVHQISPVFRRLAQDPRLCGRARQILGSGVYVHQSRVNYKRGFEGTPFQWHSDFETWHVEDGMPRMRALSVAVSLSENNDFNGPLMVVPGSHLRFVACVGETPPENHKRSLREQVYGVPDHDSLRRLIEPHGLVACKGPPGSVTFFDCNLMHGSTANLSPYPRNNVFFVYNSIDNRLEAPFADLPPRPEHIASRCFVEVEPAS
ncbi:ectoine hydroxylase [Haliangium sp.]|uniref:ectoine hydroxylase n=1 Tax=Haliangium sp. TaxID=2663208 RepID=UPI003D1189A9